jgi:predicted exporter
MKPHEQLPDGIADRWFLMVAWGDSYLSKIVHTRDMMKELAEALFGSVANSDPVEMEHHAASLADPESWVICDGKAVRWQLTMEDGAVSFALIDNPLDVKLLNGAPPCP